MNKMYNLYNSNKEPVVVVSRNIDGQYHIKGLDNTQLAHINLLLTMLRNSKVHSIF
ncbi:hypothetical protein [Staphylococcus pseudintermedius]|uniref:hypothetical protein n=1 Tax=Staphylococcus pseudintermedius TaxID=283734 RepID=UPI001F549D2B|nr:hypothetical protein [Staphylococcus pseudintermedius]